MTPELLAGAAGVLASLVASYVPGVREWFDGLEGTQKRGVMALVLLAVAVGATFAACTGTLDLGCKRDDFTGWLLKLGGVLLAALTANQSTYLIAGGKSEKPRVAKRRPTRASVHPRTQPRTDALAGSPTE